MQKRLLVLVLGIAALWTAGCGGVTAGGGPPRSNGSTSTATLQVTFKSAAATPLRHRHFSINPNAKTIEVQVFGAAGLAASAIVNVTGTSQTVTVQSVPTGLDQVVVATFDANNVQLDQGFGQVNVVANSNNQVAITVTPVSLFTKSGISPSAVAVTPNDKFVYDVTGAANTVSGFSNANGVLTPVAGSPFAAGTLTDGVAVEPAGNFLVVSNSGSNNLSVFSINQSTGALTPVAGSPFAAGSLPAQVIVVVKANRPTSPKAVLLGNEFVYVANAASNNVSAFALNQNTGSLTAVTGSPFAADVGASALVADAGANSLFVANFGDGVQNFGNVSAFSVSNNGSLIPVELSPFAIPNTASGPFAIAVDAAGANVFVACEDTDNVATFSNSGGFLTPVNGSPFSSSGGAEGIVVLPNGNFVLTANEDGDSVSSMSNGAGVLGAPAVTNLTVGSNEAVEGFAIGLDPTGSFAFVLNADANQLTSFSVNQNAGTITQIGQPVSP